MMEEKTKLLIEMQLFPFAITVDADGTRHFDKYAFAQAIAKDCIYALQLDIPRNGNTPENKRSRMHIQKLGKRYGITFPMDYYPDRET